MFTKMTWGAIAAPALCAVALTTPALAQNDVSDATGFDAAPFTWGPATGAVYTLTNEADGNRLAVLPRHFGGWLGAPMYIETGGAGSGASLGNQGALDFGLGGRVIYAVNAGSDSISVMLNLPFFGPFPIQVVDSQGTRPISLDAEGRRLYVLNAGGAVDDIDSIAGFHIGFLGLLFPIADSVHRPLSADSVGPAQIAFSGDRQHLVVTERATNSITTFAIDHWGRPSEPMPQPSAGQTPFGFMVDPAGRLVVSEAFGGAENASAVSTYVMEDGQLKVIDASVPTHETAACWVALTRNGTYAYTTNTADSTVTGFEIDGAGGARTAGRRR